MFLPAPSLVKFMENSPVPCRSLKYDSPLKVKPPGRHGFVKAPPNLTFPDSPWIESLFRGEVSYHADNFLISEDRP